MSQAQLHAWLPTIGGGAIEPDPDPPCVSTVSGILWRFLASKVAPKIFLLTPFCQACPLRNLGALELLPG